MTVRLVSDWLIPGGDQLTPIRNGAVDIDDHGRILAVGPEDQLEVNPATVEVVGGLLMPGLVNAHAHGPMSLLRSVGDGLPLQQWLTEAVWPLEGAMTPDDVVVGMELAFCEMLLAGVTTSTEMYLHEESVVAAASAIGARCQVMAGLLSILVPDDESFARRLKSIEDLRQRFNEGDSLITVGYGAHSVYDLGPGRLANLASHVDAVDAMVHIHLEETEVEREQVREAHGMTATELLDDVGLLRPHQLVAAHGVWLSDQDMALLAGASAAVVHCPQSNLKLGSGIARVSSMLKAGIKVGLGTDGAASNDNLNLWEELRLCALLARGRAHDPTAMDAAQAFLLATAGGAEAIGLSDVGRLAPSYCADIVRLDLTHPAFQPAVPEELLAHVVWAGNAHHVTDVWVQGERLVTDRELSPHRIDVERIKADATAAALRIRGAVQ